MNLFKKLFNMVSGNNSSNSSLDSNYDFYIDVYSLYMHSIITIQANKVKHVEMLTDFEYNLDLPNGYILHMKITKCYVDRIVKLKGKFKRLVKYNLDSEVKYGSDVVSCSSLVHSFYTDTNNGRITIDSLEAFKKDASRLLAYLK